MITKEEFEKRLWFYYKNELNVEYRLSVDSNNGNLCLDTVDIIYYPFNVSEITEHSFNISIEVLGKTLKETIYFHNLILKNNDNKK